MVCVLHECLGDSVPPSPRRNLPTLHAFILAVEAAEIGEQPRYEQNRTRRKVL